MHKYNLTPTQITRFWAKVRKTETCWLWQGATDPNGYGHVYLSENLRPVAHRISYELSGQVLPDDLILRHYCDTPGCVNPKHLLPGTYKDNASDMVSRGRQCKGEVHHSNKLPIESVRQIRQLYLTNNFTHAALAKRFQVNRSTVSKILQGRNWGNSE